MFTGIVGKGTLASRRGPRLSVRARIRRPRPGESVAVNGVCLTVVRSGAGTADFDLSPETLALTTLGALPAGSAVNVEPALRAGDPLGGHLLSGHVDGRGRVLGRAPMADGCLRLRVSLPRALKGLVALKGSVAVDGVSLTVTRVGPAWFETVLVPHTLRESSLGALAEGGQVNLEADMLARYVRSLLEARR